MCLLEHRPTAIVKPPAMIAGLDDLTVMRQTIQYSRGHLLILKHLIPLAEAQIGRHHHRHSLIQLGDQMKQQLSAAAGKWKIAQLVEHHEPTAAQLIRQTAAFAVASFLFELVDQIQDVEESTACATSNPAANQRHRQMRLAGAGAANQNNVPALGQKLDLGQLPHPGLGHFALAEVEVGQFLGMGQLGLRQTITQRTRLLVGDFHTQQGADDARRRMPAATPLQQTLIITGHC